MVVPNQRPRYELVGGDIETLWQRPAVEPRGIFLIAHGCSHQASDIFSTVGPDGWTMEACHTTEVGRCLGLPEESQLRRVALARGYITMAVSSTGPGRCWTKEDRRRVLAAVEHVRLHELVSNATVFAMGASSGGAFVGLLSESVASGGLPSLQCIIPQISGLSGTNRGVPTLFIHMARDRRVGELVASDMESLKRQGVVVGEIVLKPLPVTTSMLERCVAKNIAVQILQSLRAKGHVDSSGFLKQDPRLRAWVRDVAATVPETLDTLVRDESCIGEELNVAFAMHEFSAEHAHTMFDFCEGAQDQSLFSSH